VENAFAVARAYGGDYRVTFDRGYIAGHNDPRVAGWLSESAARFLGNDAIDTTRSGMGAEDFSYMSQRAPGAMLMLGAALDDGIKRGHHTPLFDIDERTLPTGAAILADTAVRFLKGENRLS
ncbi:MAG: amidohydrolase, partial [Chloroflexales bacterium]|nr:amidohydrolase [Chloroflexales bacterium]